MLPYFVIPLLCFIRQLRIPNWPQFFELEVVGMYNMALPVVEFSRQGYKIGKVFFIKINCSQMKLLKFENWTNGEPQ